MATIAARHVQGTKQIAYHYHRAHCVRSLRPMRARGPVPDGVRTGDVCVGTAERIRARCREPVEPQTVKLKEFGRVATP